MSCRRTLVTVALVLAVVSGFASRASGQEPPTSPPTSSPSTAVPAPPGEKSAAYPILLRSLYVTTIIVQGFDVHSTFKGLDAGAQEVNPFLKAITSSKPVFIAFKAAVASAAIYGAHKMARRHKVRAVLALVAVNVAYSALVVRNYRIARNANAQNAAGGAAVAFAFKF